MTNLGVIKEFISIALRERDAIRHALHVDKNNQKLQRKIKDWNTGEREGWFPCDGQTPKLLGQYRPSEGLGDFTKAYQESNATVIRVGAHTHLLPKLEAAYNAHEAYLNEASQAYEDSRTTLATFETHCATLNELINVVNAADNNADLGEHSEIANPDTRKRNKTLDISGGSKKEPYMPATWFTDKFGIPASRLRGARCSERIAAKDISRDGNRPSYRYSVPDAMKLWPEDGIYMPDTGAEPKK